MKCFGVNECEIWTDGVEGVESLSRGGVNADSLSARKPNSGPGVDKETVVQQSVKRLRF